VAEIWYFNLGRDDDGEPFVAVRKRAESLEQGEDGQPTTLGDAIEWVGPGDEFAGLTFEALVDAKGGTIELDAGKGRIVAGE
jgi:hypothetical protein